MKYDDSICKCLPNISFIMSNGIEYGKAVLVGIFSLMLTTDVNDETHHSKTVTEKKTIKP